MYPLLERQALGGNERQQGTGVAVFSGDWCYMYAHHFGLQKQHVWVSITTQRLRSTPSQTLDEGFLLF